MFKSVVNLIKTDNQRLLDDVLKSMQENKVYVGIPEDDKARNFVIAKNGVKKQTMNNATLLYIHTKGSPKMNIPARPVLEPAIEDEDNRRKIDSLFLKAVQEKLRGNDQGFMDFLQKVGMTAQNICRDWFTNPKNGWAPNQPATVLRKIRKMKGKRKIQALIDYGDGKEGIDRPLIDTAQMRKSIVWVVGK